MLQFSPQDVLQYPTVLFLFTQNGSAGGIKHREQLLTSWAKVALRCLRQACAVQPSIAFSTFRITYNLLFTASSHEDARDSCTTAGVHTWRPHTPHTCRPRVGQRSFRAIFYATWVGQLAHPFSAMYVWPFRPPNLGICDDKCPRNDGSRVALSPPREISEGI